MLKKLTIIFILLEFVWYATFYGQSINNGELVTGVCACLSFGAVLGAFVYALHMFFETKDYIVGLLACYVIGAFGYTGISLLQLSSGGVGFIH